MTSFGSRLDRAMKERGPVCAGIDPHASLLQKWGLEDSVQGLREFCNRALDGLSEAAAVKPQSAFFERFGSQGIAVLEDLLGQARERGLITILDVKRGDIGSTMAGYAAAFLPKGAPLEADAITVSPYMGPAAYDATAQLAAENGKGLFALALTSNPEGAELQRSVRDGVSVAERVIRWTTARNDQFDAGQPVGSFGVVIGATIEDRAEVVSGALENYRGPILMPGFGAQGGKVSKEDSKLNILVSSSRGVLNAGPEPADLAKALADTVSSVRSAMGGEA